MISLKLWTNILDQVFTNLCGYLKTENELRNLVVIEKQESNVDLRIQFSVDGFRLIVSGFRLTVDF